MLFAGCRLSSSGYRANSLPQVKLRDAPLIQFRGANSPTPEQPGETDCNSPAHWDGSTLYVFNSAGQPWRSSGTDLFHLTKSYQACRYDTTAAGGRWIECTWKSDDALYGWYHHEPAGICPGAHPQSPKMNLTAPKIGAVKSTDNGATWQDLGVVLEAPPGTLKCDTKNYYFAGGNGDFSIMLDSKKEFLYFFFSTYAGDLSAQGVSVARMRWDQRDRPAGKVLKWNHGRWEEPGLGGHVTPIFPASKDWHGIDADAFWGPSIHWNTHLQRYVILLNRAKDANWTQEGIYISYNSNLSNPQGWTPPQKILEAPGWYPQVIGLNQSQHETDKLCGRAARLFVRGQSRWEIFFLKPVETE